MSAIMRSLELTHTRKGAPWVQENRPADRYTWSHWESDRDVVTTLLASGSQISSYLNFFHSHHSAANWGTESFPGWLYQYCDAKGLWLLLHDGTKAKMWAYDGAPMVNLSKITPMQIAEMGRFILKHAPTADLWIDQIWYQLRDWMIVNGSTSDLRDYDPFSWDLNIHRILDMLLDKFSITTNGERRRFESTPHCWENADWGSMNEVFLETLTFWVSNASDVLTLVGPWTSPKVQLGYAISKRTNSWLWLEDDEAANLAMAG